MLSSVKEFVRYWGFLFSKFLVAGSLVALVFGTLDSFWTPVPTLHRQIPDGLGYLGYLLCCGLLFLTGIGLFYLSILDQRYRCRVCLRRLRMPVVTGSWSNMLQFGRPHTEYICTYGHGKLNIPQIHLAGMESSEWTGHAGYWEELCSIGAGEAKDSDPRY